MNEQTIADLLITVPFLLAWLFLLGYVVTLARAWNHLRAAHPSVWEALGRPSIFNVDPTVVFPARRFLWSPECHALKDQKLQNLSRLAKVLGYAGAFLFMAFALFIAWVIFYK